MPPVCAGRLTIERNTGSFFAEVKNPAKKILFAGENDYDNGQRVAAPLINESKRRAVLFADIECFASGYD